MSLSNFTVKLSPTGMEVTANGQDISDALVGIQITKPDAFTIPIITLDLRSDLVDAEVAGIPVKPQAPLDLFLEALDPDELDEQLALQGSIGEKTSETFLRLLKAKANDG